MFRILSSSLILLLMQFPVGQGTARNGLIQDISIAIRNGARARFSPDGARVCYDRIEADGFRHVYLAHASTGAPIATLTLLHPGLPQRHHGACRWHPSGDYIVWNAEEAIHYLDEVQSVGDPGVGLYHNLWSINTTSGDVTKITDVPIKQAVDDGVESYATFNPVFSPDGNELCWTQRYANLNNWGAWRIVCADVTIAAGALTLDNAAVAYTPPVGNYVVLMQMLDNPSRFLFASNYEGKHESDMDLILYNRDTQVHSKITDTDRWEEGSVIYGNKIIYMSDKGSSLASEAVEGASTKEYFISDITGRNVEKLTFFNTPGAAEYFDNRIRAAMIDIHPSGKYLLGTVGEDFGTVESPLITLRVIKITLRNAL